MKIKFWGCRGSLPASYSGTQQIQKVKQILSLAVQQKIQSEDQIDKFVNDLPFLLRSGYGTNTCCVEIKGGTEVVICDAGSGLRDLGKQLISLGSNMPKTINLMISHMHWDHIQGFPFFIPAYIQGVTINIYGCHSKMESAFVQQQEPPTFPVKLRDMGSQINFHVLDKNKSHEIAGLKFSIIEQPHPGISYGYKIEDGSQTVVYSTDAEHTDEYHEDDYPFLKFIEGADALIFDGQFSLADHLYTKQNWGHSSNLVGIELAVRAKVKHLYLFHSDHSFNDENLAEFLADSQRYLEIYNDKAKLGLSIAHDGLEVNLE